MPSSTRSPRRARTAKAPAKTLAADSRERIAAWWATVGGILHEIYEHVEALQDSPHSDMFCPFNLKELRSSLSDATCEWGAAGPKFATRFFPDIAAILGGK